MSHARLQRRPRFPLAFVLGVSLSLVLCLGSMTPALPAEKSAAKAPTWETQSQYITTLITTATTLHGQIPGLTDTLDDVLPPYEEELHRILVLSDSYDEIPRVQETLVDRLYNIVEALKKAMDPCEDARNSVKSLLERVNRLKKSLPAFTQNAENTPAEQRAHVEAIRRIETQLSQSLVQLNMTLEHPQALLLKSQQLKAELEKSLPDLWVQLYLAPPLRETYFELWKSLGLKLKESQHTLSLRLETEIPSSPGQWKSVASRFLTTLFLGGVLAVYLYRRCTQWQEGDVAFPPHIFYTCGPWILIGASAVVAAMATGQVYPALLSLGNLLLIIGQISLAWALRRWQRQGCPKASPFRALCAVTLVGYALLFPSLPISLQAFIWLGTLIIALLWQRFHRIQIPLQLETTLFALNTAFLWISLILLVIGMPQLSILVYILFAALVAAVQLSMGGVHALHLAAKHLPKDNMKAIISSIWLACMVPVMVIVVLLSLALWIITLPGGYSLLYKYMLAGFSIGETHFNILHLLLILSAFYFTRTVVNIGSSFLAKMPMRGIRIDASLIPPLQTAFTYGTWGLFGLLVLKALGVQLSNLAMVAGGLSVGIGFGMQAIVNNFLSGLILIFSRTLQEGDVVDVGGVTGTVRKISVRATTVETSDNAVIYVPNSEFISSRLINWTRNSHAVRRELTVGVAYGSDTAQIIKLLLEATKACPEVQQHPAPSVLFANFGNSTLDFSLRFWVHGFFTAPTAASSLRLEIERLFREHNVDVAFPQLDVHIREMPKTS